MVNKCAAFGCKSGYKSTETNHTNDVKITTRFHFIIANCVINGSEQIHARTMFRRNTLDYVRYILNRQISLRRELTAISVEKAINQRTMVRNCNYVI